LLFFAGFRFARAAGFRLESPLAMARQLSPTRRGIVKKDGLHHGDRGEPRG
jgi:hypothetical protein